MTWWGGSAERDVTARLWSSMRIAYICDSFIRVAHPYVWLIRYIEFTDWGPPAPVWTCQKRHAHMKRDLYICEKRPVCMTYTWKETYRYVDGDKYNAKSKRDSYLYVCCHTSLWKETCMYDQYIKKTHKYVDGDKCNVYAKRGLYVCGNTNLYVCGNTNLYVERDSCVICMWLKTYKDPNLYVERDSCVICMWLKTYKDPFFIGPIRKGSSCVICMWLKTYKDPPHVWFVCD